MDNKLLKRVKRRDRIARWVITVGGMAIIGSVILILILIGQVSLPLFEKPKSEVFAKLNLSASVDMETVRSIGVDEYLETVYLVDEKGRFTFFETVLGDVFEQIQVSSPSGPDAFVSQVEKVGSKNFNLLWSDGSLTVERVHLKAHFDQQNKRSFTYSVERLANFSAHKERQPERSLARLSSEGRLTRVDLMPDNRLMVEQQVIEADLFGNEEKEIFSFALNGISDKITALALDAEGNTLYAGTDRGALLLWDLSEPDSPVLKERFQAFRDRRAITALTLVLGDISLAVGDAKGNVSTWFPVASESSGGEKKLHRIHTLASHYSPVTAIIPSQRNKSLLSLDEAGVINLDHMTSERHLLSLQNHLPLAMVDISARGNGIVGLNEKGRAILWKIDNPHPEVSWKTLFGKVWYESYDEPAFVWQSSSASDDFEPKLSLTPLIFGTMKGTFYAMIFAVPLALFGAIYTSQFGNDRLRQVIKPTVEIMAAIPSVIIGFLAALWFAPIVEKSVSGLFLSLVLIPIVFLAAVIAWQRLRAIQPLKRVEKGYEFLVLAPLLVLAAAISFQLGPLIETWFFAGDFKLWLFQEHATRYDPRNNIIIAFALGFAVIPIIFTIAEDSLSNVPPSLRAASLALGASRWQTVWRVILPSASPGIFAGIMIGFGRAVGETMIVLMATGNTPIMDWSIFNGMRPLSSNIAVEIPEAPHGETLYRVLFLSAVLLFILTFVLNTVAEVVRQRLRKKYGRF